MRNIQKLNEISAIADSVFTDYNYSKDVENPDGIMVRSAKMHDMQFGDKLLAIARAGAGTNNIPIDRCTENGIVVFNTPGANANAVKELVLYAMLCCSRKVVEGIEWANTLKAPDVAKQVEAGKNNFVGPELFGKKLAVVGLGAIGALVANAAVNLGMEVYGYDPYISIDQAWGLSRAVKHVTDFNELISHCDYLTLHVPLLPSTKEIINETTIAKMHSSIRIINCARGELVSTEAIKNAVTTGKVAAYVTDFPNEELLNVPNIVCIPHLGASTPEAEDNCALAAAKQLRDYIENGNIKNSVNFKAASMPRIGVARVAIIHKNVKNTLSQLTSIIGDKSINIANMINTSSGDYAYTMFDLDSDVDADTVSSLKAVDGVIRIRVIR